MSTHDELSARRFLWRATATAFGASIPLVVMYFLRTSPWASYLPGPLPRSAAAEAFAAKLPAYEARLSMLDTNLKLQGLIAVISVAVMTSRKRALEVPVFKIGVPTTALYLLLPLIAMFLWLQFGYLLSALIDLRISLFQAAGVGITPAAGPTSLDSRVFTLRNALNDGGFLDAWFRQYLPNFIDGRRYGLGSRLGNAVAVTVVYGGLLGGAHAAMVYTLYLGAHRLRRHPLGTVYRHALVAFSALLIWTHWQFFFAESNQSWQHLGVALGFVGFLWLIDHVLNAFDNVGPQSPTDEPLGTGSCQTSRPD